jgi:hypothetical protein
MSNTNGTKTDKTALESWNKGIFDLESPNEDIFYDEGALSACNDSFLSEWTAYEESRKQRVKDATSNILNSGYTKTTSFSGYDFRVNKVGKHFSSHFSYLRMLELLKINVK